MKITDAKSAEKASEEVLSEYKALKANAIAKLEAEKKKDWISWSTLVAALQEGAKEIERIEAERKAARDGYAKIHAKATLIQRVLAGIGKGFRETHRRLGEQIAELEAIKSGCDDLLKKTKDDKDLKKVSDECASALKEMGRLIPVLNHSIQECEDLKLPDELK